MKAAAEKGTCAVNARSIAESVAGGGRFQELTLGEAGGGNRVFRLFAPDGTRILKIYESHGHQRREFHALQALGAVDGTPALIDRYEDETTTWAMFADAGKWNLGSLPENEGLARRAGAIHDSGAKVSNLARGIDADMIATDFYSAIRRLQRYRGRLRFACRLVRSRISHPTAACYGAQGLPCQGCPEALRRRRRRIGDVDRLGMGNAGSARVGSNASRMASEYAGWRSSRRSLPGGLRPGSHARRGRALDRLSHRHGTALQSR